MVLVRRPASDRQRLPVTVTGSRRLDRPLVLPACDPGRSKEGAVFGPQLAPLSSGLMLKR